LETILTTQKQPNNTLHTMKILFLDHDGVICLSQQWGTRFDKDTDTIDSAFDDFDPGAIEVLNQIIEETDCEIVVSSDWRHHCELWQMQQLYLERGIKKGPIDFTNWVPSSAQCLEIARMEEIRQWLWLESNRGWTSWCAVDDMDLGGEFGLSNFVRTPRSSEGIKQTGVKEKIIKFLNR